MSQTILILSPDAAISSILAGKLSAEGDLVSFSRFSSAYDSICNEMPLLLIVDVGADPETASHLSILKDDPLFSGLPIIALFDEPDAFPGWESLPVDDYLWKKDVEREIVMKVQLCLLRAQRVVEVNPLTRLPGNISINRRIQDHIDRKESFALAYADLDNFKPYNDTYGFSRGDEVLRITGRLLLNITKSGQPRDSFVGHIGGDDFVFITGPAVIEETCREVIEAFDRIIPTFYDRRDRDRGFILGHDRAGAERRFPLLSISIGVAFSTGDLFSHFGEITQIASEVKSFAKEQEGSCYRLDRRAGLPAGS
ncbi:MAG: diguanylate cyclase [Deltaproteobacteria bacterium]|nr:diguanylate cyclase [Deltaproteobacteria bacterium]